MSDAVPKFERLLGRINILYGLQLPVGIATLLVIILWISKPTYFQANSLIPYICMIVATTIVSVVHSQFNERLQKWQLAVIYGCYHLSLVIFTVFVAPYLSPFEFLWIALAIGMDLLFGKKPMYASLAVYATVLVLAFLKTGQSVDIEIIIRTIMQLVGVSLIATQVSHYRRISDQERTVLDSTTRQTDFERQRLLSLINNMGEAVIATNKKGKILLYNAAVLNLLDTNQSLENKTLDSLLNLKDSDKKPIKLAKLLKDSPAGISSTDYVHQFSKNDAMNLYINVASVRLGFREELDSGYIVIMRDITKEKSLEEERDEFISVVSHELRTPVAIAEGNISNAIFMNKTAKNVKMTHESLNQAHEQVIFLANMINDLATLSRAERTDVEVEIEPLDPSELLHTLAKDYEPQAAEKKLKLTASAAKDSQVIHTSHLYLREILQNFITNAIKYTKKGSVVVHVRSNKNGDAVFSVADTGIGLSKADQKHAFDKFFRSEDFRTRESSGTGLGLYVTAKLAHRIGATVTIESELNKGTTFSITVPSMKLENT